MLERRFETLGDTAKDPYAAARDAMIEHQLRCRGIVSHCVLEAMRAIPRHLFVPRDYAHRAYADEALPSHEGQTISQPYIVAVMTQELELSAPNRPDPLRILEIGTGTGYQTAILATIASPRGTVYTIERMPGLAESARRLLEAMAIDNVRYFTGDGSGGWPADAALWDGPRSAKNTPLFDRIMVTAGAPHVPNPLLGQLAEGGIMVVPVGDTDSQMLIRIERRENRLTRQELMGCRFVPLLGAFAWRSPDAPEASR